MSSFSLGVPFPEEGVLVHLTKVPDERPLCRWTSGDRVVALVWVSVLLFYRVRVSGFEGGWIYLEALVLSPPVVCGRQNVIPQLA